MMRTAALTILFLVIAPVQADEPSGTSVETVTIQFDDLRAVFRDNSESPKILSGIQSLVNSRAAAGFDAFDPDSPGASAGLNFEHIISGHASQNNKFTPRHGRYLLYRPSKKEQTVMLVRKPEDSPWAVSSTLKYTLQRPDAIDMEFRCKAHKPELFGERRYAIFFFANYMNDVEDAALHFRGVKAPAGREEWIAGNAPKGPPDWNGGGTYRHRDAAPLKYDDDVKFRLNTWSYDFPRYTQPFYYGRAAHGMVYILMFDRASTPEDQIRFSLFKFKLNQFPRPAWDFQYVIHRVEAGKEYGFRARAIWKKFISADDCLREYEKWKESLRR